MPTGNNKASMTSIHYSWMALIHSTFYSRNRLEYSRRAYAVVNRRLSVVGLKQIGMVTPPLHNSYHGFDPALQLHGSQEKKKVSLNFRYHNWRWTEPLQLPSFGIFHESIAHSSLLSPITPEVLELLKFNSPLTTHVGKFSIGFNGPPRGRYVFAFVCRLRSRKMFYSVSIYFWFHIISGQ
jgi:hypothetical protein